MVLFAYRRVASAASRILAVGLRVDRLVEGTVAPHANVISLRPVHVATATELTRSPVILLLTNCIEILWCVGVRLDSGHFIHHDALL